MFQFTDEQKMIKEMVERLGRDEIGPLTEAADATGYSSPEIVRHLAGNGLLKMSLPTEYGGIDADYTTIAAVVEELAKVDASAAMIVFVNQTVIQILRDWGNEAQKAEFFGRMSSGDKINAFSLTEPGFGSESGSIQTRAVREKEHYVVNGTKIFVSNGDIADFVALMVRTGEGERHRGLSALIVEKGPRDFRGKTRKQAGAKGYRSGGTHI